MSNPPNDKSEADHVRPPPDEAELERSSKTREASKIVIRLKHAQKSSKFLFRGMGNCDHSLVPFIARKRYNGRRYSMKHEKLYL